MSILSVDSPELVKTITLTTHHPFASLLIPFSEGHKLVPVSEHNLVESLNYLGQSAQEAKKSIDDLGNDLKSVKGTVEQIESTLAEIKNIAQDAKKTSADNDALYSSTHGTCSRRSSSICYWPRRISMS